MIKNKKVNKQIEVADVLVCDVCQREYKYDDDVFDIQEFVHIYICGGYGSVFGDGAVLKLDICQHCLNKKLGKYFRVVED